MLVAYVMKPKAGYDHLATAAQATGFAKSVDALVYYIGPENEVISSHARGRPLPHYPILNELMKALEQSRYADLSLDEDTLIRNGRLA